MIPKFIKGMEATETKKGKEWIVYPKGKEPIRVLIDKRLKPHSLGKLGGLETYSPGIYSYPEERLISIHQLQIYPTSVGHEFGHILMGHKGLERDVVTPRWIQDELEAEYWAYRAGYPRRKTKIAHILGLALAIGMTKKEFKELEKKVREDIR